MLLWLYSQHDLLHAMTHAAFGIQPKSLHQQPTAVCSLCIRHVHLQGPTSLLLATFGLGRILCRREHPASVKVKCLSCIGVAWIHG